MYIYTKRVTVVPASEKSTDLTPLSLTLALSLALSRSCPHTSHARALYQKRPPYSPAAPPQRDPPPLLLPFPYAPASPLYA